MLCRTGARLNSALAPYTFFCVLRSVPLVIYLAFQLVYNFLKSVNMVQFNGFFIYGLTLEIISLLVVFLSADLPAYQVRR